MFARVLAVRVHFGCERVWDLSANAWVHVEVHFRVPSRSVASFFVFVGAVHYRKFCSQFFSMLNNVRRLKEELQDKHPKVGELFTKLKFYSRQLRDPKVKIRNVNGGNRVAPSP